MTKWFVMICAQSGIPVLMTEDEMPEASAWDAALFDSEQEAEDAAAASALAAAYGFQVYEWSFYGSGGSANDDTTR